MKQITLNFDASLFSAYPTCREYIARQVHHQSAPHKAIASDMDYSPSKLTRKLAQADNCRFTLDDAELFMSVTGDITPVYYLLEKFITGKRNKEQLQKLKAEIEAQLEDLREAK